MRNVIYTIGHSVHEIDFFISLLTTRGIEVLADVRSFPRSKRQPQFNEQPLSRSLQQAGIHYRHFPALGGKGIVMPQTAAIPFAGYTAYMHTDSFRESVTELEALARQQPVAYMCAEADWQHCHRSHISDYLAGQGWEVQHITAAGALIKHGPPRHRQGRLF